MKKMMDLILWVLLLTPVAFLNGSCSAQTKPQENIKALKWKLVWVWSLPKTTDQDLEAMVTKAKALGFNAIESDTTNSKAFVRVCSQYQMESFSPIFLGKDHPQKLSEKETTLPASRDKSPSYQFGGEPVTEKIGTEILFQDQNCFNQPAVFDFVKKQIDEAIICGYSGLAFDFFGYRNYHSCECDECKSLFKSSSYPGLSPEKAWDKFQEDSIVRFYEKAVGYTRAKAKSMNRPVKTTCHVYPVFLPNILYGHRIPVDYCGETVSWFFKPYWSFDKIAKYSNLMVKHQADDHPNTQASPFIGVDANDIKTPERIRQEIRIIKQSGAQAIQFAELGYILATPQVAKVITEELNEK